MSMRPKGLIIGKWKCWRCRDLGISGVDIGRAASRDSHIQVKASALLVLAPTAKVTLRGNGKVLSRFFPASSVRIPRSLLLATLVS